MDKEEQGKVVEGLTLLVKNTEEETEQVIHDKDFRKTKGYLILFKKSLEIIRRLDYFPEKQRIRLEALYNVAVQNAEAIFGKGQDYEKNIDELMDVLK